MFFGKKKKAMSEICFDPKKQKAVLDTDDGYFEAFNSKGEK